MTFENFERGYLLPKGCKDLIDAIGHHREPESKIFVKLPFVHSKPQTSISLKSAPSPPAMKGDLFVSDKTTVKDLAVLLGQKAFQIIADAMGLGIFATVNQPLGFKATSQIAKKYGYIAKRSA